MLYLLLEFRCYPILRIFVVWGADHSHNCPKSSWTQISRWRPIPEVTRISGPSINMDDIQKCKTVHEMQFCERYLTLEFHFKLLQGLRYNW